MNELTILDQDQSVVSLQLKTQEQIKTYFEERILNADIKTKQIEIQLVQCEKKRCILNDKLITALKDYKRPFFNDYEKVIDDIQEVLEANSGSMVAYEEALKLMFEYQKEMAEMISIVMNSCSSNLALTTSTIDLLDTYIINVNDSYDISTETLTQLIIMQNNLKSLKETLEKLENNDHRISQLEEQLKNLLSSHPKTCHN